MILMMNEEYLKIPEISEGPHFKYLSKHRFMDTSNWIRLKKGYDSLDASDNPPVICWERIGPERVRPVLTGSKTPRPISSRRPGSTHRPSTSHGEGMTRSKPTVRFSLETEVRRPIDAWTVDEIKSTMYAPKLKKVPLLEKTIAESKQAPRARMSLANIVINKDEAKEEPASESKNPYKEFYINRNLEGDSMLAWMKALWKIASEFIVWFDSLGATIPEITDSFMVNLLATGCQTKELAPFQIKQLEDTKVDLPPLVFERPINYGINPFNSQESTVKILTKRERALAYGGWQYPIKIWGKINAEVAEKVKEQKRTEKSEQALLQYPRFKNYCAFLKDKGYRIPEILYTMMEENKKR